MFEEPLRESYSKYGEYALAVIGYAFLRSRDVVACGGDANFHSSLGCVHFDRCKAVESSSGFSSSGETQVQGAGGRFKQQLSDFVSRDTGGCESDGVWNVESCSFSGAVGGDKSLGCSVQGPGNGLRGRSSLISCEKKRESVESSSCVEGVGSTLHPTRVLDESDSTISGISGTVKSNVQSTTSTCVEGEVVVDRCVGEDKKERNRLWREKKKERKKKRQNMNSDWRKRGLADEGPLSLRVSLEKKWKAQNDLAVEKAQRELEVLKASSIDQEVKRYRTKVSAATERNMVSIEKTHAFLRNTGNVPGERGGGFAETVVSGEPGLESGSGTISPDSSASMAEFRNCQKALLDSEKKNVEYERIIKIATEKYGFPVERVDYMDKTVWTDTQSNRDILDDLYPDGYGMNTYTFDDGKFMPIRI